MEKSKKNKSLLIIFGIFALGIVTGATSYAFFRYSRVGTTTNTIISGDISFTYEVGETVGVSNAFPVSDESEKYTLDVKM